MFRELTEQEKIKYQICNDSQHFPPSYMVYKEYKIWICPKCGKETLVGPTYVTR